jgi:hypothetical protein
MCLLESLFKRITWNVKMLKNSQYFNAIFVYYSLTTSLAFWHTLNKKWYRIICDATMKFNGKASHRYQHWENTDVVSHVEETTKIILGRANDDISA